MGLEQKNESLGLGGMVVEICAAGNDETLIKPCDFGGGVASGLTKIISR